MPKKMRHNSKFDTFRVRPILHDEVKAWIEHLCRYHYPGFRGIAGRSMRYVATMDREWVALIGWGSAVLKFTAWDKYIWWNEETKLKRLHLIVDNVRFLVLPDRSMKNLTSKVLSMNLKRVSDDFQTAYGHPVYLAESYVDVSR